MRRPFYATDVPGLQSTAVPQPPAQSVEGNPYAEGYAAGRLEERAAVVQWLRATPAARLWRQEPMDAAADALCRGEHVHAPAPDLTADRAQVRALGER